MSILCNILCIGMGEKRGRSCLMLQWMAGNDQHQFNMLHDKGQQHKRTHNTMTLNKVHLKRMMPQGYFANKTWTLPLCVRTHSEHVELLYTEMKQVNMKTTVCYIGISDMWHTQLHRKKTAIATLTLWPRNIYTEQFSRSHGNFHIENHTSKVLDLRPYCVFVLFGWLFGSSDWTSKAL